MQLIQRQGDVLIISMDALPEDVQPIPRIGDQIILAYGEVTGHKHAIQDIDVKWFGTLTNRFGQMGTQFLEAAQPFTLVHEEHAPLTFPPGYYRVVRQYEATADDLRPVFD